MARLLCLILTLLLALPAVQARACGPATGHAAAQALTHGQDHGADHRGEGHAPDSRMADARHDCLGCIAPIDRDTSRPAERSNFALDRAPRSADAPFPASLGSPPEPPPPRRPV